MPKLTVITPTYNRAECLNECWESLKKQTCKDFQWLIIDDGSTDNTREVVENFIANSDDIFIDYVYKENGGKHTALNKSHEHIVGDYVVILDSDDTFTENAVEDILGAWNKFDKNSEVGRVIFLKGYSEDKPICYVKSEGVPVDTLVEPRIGTDGRDCCDTFRTSLFVKCAFPVFEGERFIGEGAGFFPMELESKGVYVNKVIYLCDYREDGLTRAGRKMRLLNPLGGMYNSQVYMHKRLPFKIRLKKAVLYACYSKFANIGFSRALKESKYKALTLATWLPGLCLHLYWKKKYF